MKTALFADIHANREALQACLAHARGQGAERHVFLGDIVGYGADPLACLDLVRGFAAAPCVLGNHDAAALGGLGEDMNPVARESAYWTRRQLGSAERDFLAGLPLTVQRQAVRACLRASSTEWEHAAGKVPRRCAAPPPPTAGIFAGHRTAVVFFAAAGAWIGAAPGVPVPLPRRRRWLAVAGSVGQPRDGQPAAAYLLFDDEKRHLVFQRVPYDAARAAAKVIAAGLPVELAARLERGV
jgi:diadenosine tetraphosphatase ApaH/serine/threonine PP2A family protein phosphatase